MVRFIVSLDEDGQKLKTIKLRLVCISMAHRSAECEEAPTKNEMVRSAIKGIANRLAESGDKVRKVEPILIGDIHDIVNVLEKEKSLKALRDAAMILLGFSLALRRSELCGLKVEDIAFTLEGMEIAINRSKTDQTGEGEKLPVWVGQIPITCPVRALKKYLEASSVKDGFLFRSMKRNGAVRNSAITDQAFAKILKASCKAAGLNESKYSSHSLRRGFITQGTRNGASCEE